MYIKVAKKKKNIIKARSERFMLLADCPAGIEEVHCQIFS